MPSLRLAALAALGLLVPTLTAGPSTAQSKFPERCSEMLDTQARTNCVESLIKKKSTIKSRGNEPVPVMPLAPPMGWSESAGGGGGRNK